MTGPVSVTMQSNTSGAMIRYTRDGSTPTGSSPVYTGPIQLSSSAVVQARAFLSGSNASAPSIASYQVMAGSPTVQFAVLSDSEPHATTSICYPVLALSGLSDETVSITYTVQPVSGSITKGSATFLPGELYRYLAVPVSGPATIVLTSATGAMVGANNTFKYSVQ